MDLGPLVGLPGWFWDVPYREERVPGAVRRGHLREGGNCQLWAYEVLDHFGIVIPDFRSDELWNDGQTTERVDDPEPLDLVLYNDSDTPYGAHVGVWTGEAVAHLCREIGRPTVWRQADFDARARYSRRLGFKRPIRRAP